MRLLVTGSRDWEGVAAEARVQVTLNMILALCDVLGTKLTLVHGDCPTGADAIADRWARRRDNLVTVEPHPARWVRHGGAAGPIRNLEMVNRGADMCIAFLKDDSRGTSNCVSLSRMAGIPTFVVHWKEVE